LIDRLIALSVRQRPLVFVLALVFVLLGLVATTKVPIDAVPDVTNVQVQVITPAPALGPLDVETYVTVPVERVMSGLPGLQETRSISRAGISVVTLVFDDATDLYFARQLVDQRLSSARDQISADYGRPELGPISSGLGEILHFEVTGKRPLMERRSILDWQIAPRLRQVPGVTELNVFGGEAKSLELSLDPQKLASARLGVADVVTAIGQNHCAVGGAYLVDGREHVTVRGEGRIRTPEDLGNVVVDFRDDKTPLYARDLGEISFSPLVRYGAATRDGRPDEAVIGVVMMLRGANSRSVVDAVSERIADIRKSLPEGVGIEVYYNRVDLVNRTIHTVTKNLVEASLLVLLVLFVMLMQVRAGLVVAISIPLALLGAFVGMWVGGIAGNLISLGAIDFGLVVDGAIIIIENSIKRVAQRREALGRALTAEERDEAVIAASQEVRKATAFGEAIIALVYVPIVALQSVEGRMFRPMALTVLFALAAAFVMSITLVPALASALLPRTGIDRQSPIMRLSARLYKAPLRWATTHPLRVVLAAVGLFALSLWVGSRMGRDFLPKLDEGTVVIATVRLPSVSLDQSLAQSRQIERTLKQFTEVKSVICRTGRAEIAVDPMGMNMTDVYVLLEPKEKWKVAQDREALVELFDHALRDGVPGAGFSYTQPIEMNTNDLLAGISSDLALHLYGSDLGVLRQLADKVVRTLRGIPGARDVRAEQIAGTSILAVNIDRAAVARYGLSSKTVLETISAVGGISAGEIVDGLERYPIRVRLSATARKDAETLAALPVRTPSGALVPIGQLARIAIVPGPPQISRDSLQRRVTVQANVRKRDIASFVEEAKGILERQVRLPAGYFTAWAGEYERLQSATRQLMIVVPIALALIIVLLIATFGKVRPALLIFANVPMSISGGIAALLLRGQPLTISAYVGFIALFGVAVLNGLVLVSSIERLKLQLPLMDAVLRGAEGRLRPVLTTALVASLGFLPMALSTGAGAEVQRPLATVVIGGLISSTLLTLLVLPALYLLTERRPRNAA